MVQSINYLFSTFSANREKEVCLSIVLPIYVCFVPVFVSSYKCGIMISEKAIFEIEQDYFHKQEWVNDHA